MSETPGCGAAPRATGILGDTQARWGPRVTGWQPGGQMQPQRKGRSLSQLAGRCQTLGACVHGFLLGNPRAALGAQGPGGPTQNRGLGDAEGSAGGRPPKEPPGHVPDTHLFTSSRPGRSAVPCKFRIAPHDERPRLRAGCVSGSPGCDPLGAAAAAASAGGPAGVSRSTSSLGTAAGRASSAPRGRDAAVRRAGAPSWPGACCRRGAASSWRAWTMPPPSLGYTESGFPFLCSVPSL